jgi:tetratricopeptide (TPR) repeat protein
VKVPNPAELYLAKMREELRSNTGFVPAAWSQAARYALENKLRLDEALEWARYAVNAPFIGTANFDTLSTLSQLEEANGLIAEGQLTMERALAHPSATPIGIHQYGRRLLAAGKNDEALRVFQLNAKKHPNAWPVNVGLARGHAAMGNTKEALRHARLAVAQAPDEANRRALEAMVKGLEAGKTTN